MKPDVDRMLEVSAIALMTQLGPSLPTSYAQSTAGSLGALLLAVREEFERAAARRVEENESVRTLFAQAVDVVEDDALATRLREAGNADPAGLEISTLERENAELRGLLIELHAHVESLDTESSRALDEAIWSELARSTERRKLSMDFF